MIPTRVVGRVLNDLEVWARQPQFVRDAFKAGQGQKVQLPAGFMISKLSDFPELTEPGKTALSPWWSPYEQYQYDSGFHRRMELAKRLGVTIRELSRQFVAVKENWNSLGYLLVAKLTVPVHAFFGGVKGQTRLDMLAMHGPVDQSGVGPGHIPAPSKVLPGEGRAANVKGLVGGAGQFYIPNLTTAQATMSQRSSLT